MGKGTRWWMPLRFCDLHGAADFRRLSDAEKWQVVENLCDGWLLGQLPAQPAGVPDAAWAVVERLWPTYADEIKQAEAISKKRQQAAASRWNANASRLQSKRNATTQNNTTQTLTPKGVRSRRAPAAFTPDDSHRAIAEERGIDLDAQLAAFKDYEFATAKSDWPATFRNWLRRATAAPFGSRALVPKPHATDVRLRAFLTEVL